jgi:hypothetical protein
MGRRWKTALLAGLFVAGYGTTAFAELTYTVEVGAGHSDNITRAETDEVSESMATAGLTLEWQEERPRLTADVSVDADYVHYLDDTYEGEVVGGMDAMLNFKILPDRLSWLVQDSFGQEASDPFSPVTPETREDVNYFTTGPTLEFLVGRALAQMFAMYSQTDFERSPFDSDRVLGGVSVGRRRPGGSGFALNAVTEAVKFKDELSTDYDRDSAYLTYERDGARTEISAEAGYTWLELEDGTKSGDPRFLLTVNREMSPATSLALRLGTQLTDSSDALRAEIGGGTGAPGGGSGVSSAASPFENRHASLAWQFNRHRTSLSLGGQWSDDTYEESPALDRDRLSWNASVGRQISNRLSLSLQGELSKEEFATTGDSFETIEIGASVNWQLGPTIGLRLDLLRSDRSTSDATGEYAENRAFLSLVYRSGTARQPGTSAP